MAERMQWGRKTPGLLVFLIDQSGSMYSGKNDERVAKAIQDAVFECFSACISGDNVKARFNLVLIGYGAKVEEIWSGWINDDSLAQKLQEANDRGGSFIPAVCDGGTPMAQAFEMAKEKIENWISELEEQKKREQINGIPAPIIINVTDGYPDSQESARRAAQDLLNMKTEDGNVMLFNMHISARKTDEILFPKDKSQLSGSQEGNFLFDISTELDEDMVNVAFSNGFEKVKPGAKGMIANACGETIAKFISFGSAVSGVTQK